MTKFQKIIIGASVVIGILLVSVAFIVARHRNNSSLSAKITQHSVSQAELAKSNGRNGNACYVAIDGTVYLIKDFSLWQNGKHLTSNGLAYCGADLSKAIDMAPHGRRILNILPKVGHLVP